MQTRYSNTHLRLRSLRASFATEIMRCAALAGGDAAPTTMCNCFLVNDNIALQHQVTRAHQEASDALRWRIPILQTGRVDFVLAPIMDTANQHATAYHLLPTRLFDKDYIIIRSEHKLEFQAHAFPSLVAIFGLQQGSTKAALV